MGHFEKHDLKTKSTFSLLQSEEKASIDSYDGVMPEPIYPESYDLSSTCLLIPRAPSHQLKADLAERMSQGLQQICASHNCRIEFITVTPDYFQWGLRVIPSIQIDQSMHEVRYRISELILFTFEHIRNENSIIGFWMSGYLVVLRTCPHPKEMIEQYIRTSNRQQRFSLPDLQDLHLRT